MTLDPTVSYHREHAIYLSCFPGNANQLLQWNILFLFRGDRDSHDYNIKAPS